MREKRPQVIKSLSQAAAPPSPPNHHHHTHTHTHICTIQRPTARTREINLVPAETVSPETWPKPFEKSTHARGSLPHTFRSWKRATMRRSCRELHQTAAQWRPTSTQNSHTHWKEHTLCAEVLSKKINEQTHFEPCGRHSNPLQGF